MNLKIWGASTLASFTKSITEGMEKNGIQVRGCSHFSAGLAQIHGSPQATSEDEFILKEVERANFPIIYLIHRPDEVLENQNLVSALTQLKSEKFILLGDLVFQLPFWASRQNRCEVIPHPFTDFTMPKSGNNFVVGSFTSWGEMRNLEHYLSLVEALRGKGPFEFQIGGSGLSKAHLPSDVSLATDFFVPHFNTQFYHLHGKKRIGESSGSLHRGISIPVIFEANGAERLESLISVKVEADDNLANINFERAATIIQQMAFSNLDQSLKHNLKSAKNNSVEFFGCTFKKLFDTNFC